MRRLARWPLTAILTWLALNVAPAVAASVAEPERGNAPFDIRWATNAPDGRSRIEVTGLDLRNLRELQRAHWENSRWQQLLAVYADQRDAIGDVGLPPMIGTYGVSGDVLFFQPQFPLDPGVVYRATFRPARLPLSDGIPPKMIVSNHQSPVRVRQPTTVVSEVFPTSDELPENLLKFYLHFSAPMSRGHSYDYVHLYDVSGKAVELPFLELEEELWNPAMTRLTLIIDPGRIKRGVRPLEEIGPALEAGKEFHLVIDGAWRDAAGSPLRKPFRKTFRVGVPDREPPDPAAWKIQAPKRDTREPLVIQFPEPMDRALAERMIHVVTGSGDHVAGDVVLEDRERRWRFVPRGEWRGTSGRLLVETTIEDLAGNNIGKPFEVDLLEPAGPRLSRPTVSLTYILR